MCTVVDGLAAVGFISHCGEIRPWESVFLAAATYNSRHVETFYNGTRTVVYSCRVFFNLSAARIYVTAARSDRALWFDLAQRRTMLDAVRYYTMVLILLCNIKKHNF